MQGIPRPGLEDYFTKAELKVLEAGDGLPAIGKTLDALRFKRVGTTVLNGLIEGINTDTQFQTIPYLIDSAPHPHLPNPTERIEVAVEDLPPVGINKTWALNIRVGVPLHPNELDDSRPLNPEPFTNSIHDLQSIMFTRISWWFTEGGIKNLGTSDFVDIEQTAFDYDLEFTRVGAGYEWEARTPNVSLSQQTEFLLLLGRAAALTPPYLAK
jgi:hypothetical protein